MPLEEIKLAKARWWIDSARQIGRTGGFGAVFRGRDEKGGEVAVKKLHLSAESAAHRELTIAAELARRDLKYVIPILDAGRDAQTDSYYIVMPIADKSLADYLAPGAALDEAEACAILSAIANGLAEVPDIVHRDLKPGNVLLHESAWKIADFGIARFVEESTSLNTLKACLTPAFASPEQFTLSRSEHAADVYSLGCIAHLLLNARPPFPGPSMEEFAEQHTSHAPPALNTGTPQLSALVALMLRKPPAVRPDIRRVIHVLGTLKGQVKPSAPRALHSYAAQEAERLAREDAKKNEYTSRKRDALAIAEDGSKRLWQMIEELGRRVVDQVPSAGVTAPESGCKFGDGGKDAKWRVRLNKNSDWPSLHARVPQSLSVQFNEQQNHSQWRILADGHICIDDPSGDLFCYAHLCLTDAGRGEQFRWWQVRMRKPGWRCFDMGKVDLYRVDRAIAGKVNDVGQLPGKDAVYPQYDKPWPVEKEWPTDKLMAEPSPFDDEDFESFCDWWTDALATAGLRKRY